MLAVATSGPHGEIGLRLDDGTVVSAPLPSARSRGRDIAPSIDALLRRQGLTPDDLEGIAVDVGPGSFTGVRVGVTTAKTLAYALGIRALAASSLEILAEAASTDGPVLALRDAGRGTVYYALFRAREGGERRCTDGPARVAAADLPSTAATVLAVGEEAPALKARYGLPGEALEVAAGAPALLALAAARLQAAGGPGALGAPHALIPLYLQASSPERRLAGEEA